MDTETDMGSLGFEGGGFSPIAPVAPGPGIVPPQDTYLSFDSELSPTTIKTPVALPPSVQTSNDPSSLGFSAAAFGGRLPSSPVAATPSLFSSPQFMAPVAASLLNGIFSFYISERMAKEQRRTQQEMLDAQFEVAAAQEESRVQRGKDIAEVFRYAAGKRGK